MVRWEDDEIDTMLSAANACSNEGFYDSACEILLILHRHVGMDRLRGKERLEDEICNSIYYGMTAPKAFVEAFGEFLDSDVLVEEL